MGKFVVRATDVEDGKPVYEWKLFAPNGKCVARCPRPYKSKAACLNGIDSVLKNMDARIEVI